MLTIVEYNHNDEFKRRTGRVAKIPLETREQFKIMFGELRKGLYIYERDIDFNNTSIIDLNYLLTHCE